MKKFLLSLIAVVSLFVFVGCDEDSNPTGSNEDNGNSTVNPNHDIALYGTWRNVFSVRPREVTDTGIVTDTIWNDGYGTSLSSTGAVSTSYWTFTTDSLTVRTNAYNNRTAIDNIVSYYNPNSEM